jgi:hypothetical protein
MNNITCVPTPIQLQVAFRMAREAQHFWAMIVDSPEIYAGLNYNQFTFTALDLLESNKAGLPGFVEFKLRDGTQNHFQIIHRANRFYWEVDDQGIITVGINDDKENVLTAQIKPKHHQVPFSLWERTAWCNKEGFSWQSLTTFYAQIGMACEAQDVSTLIADELLKPLREKAEQHDLEVLRRVCQDCLQEFMTMNTPKDVCLVALRELIGQAHGLLDQLGET